MKRKKKRIMGKILRGVLTMAMLVCLPKVTGLSAEAAEIVQCENSSVDVLRVELQEMNAEEQGNSNARTMMINCSIGVSCSEAGLHIEITTGAIEKVSVLGIKDIVIKQKVWYGWKTIATGSGAEVEDASLMGVVIDYPNVEVGETYRITCVHYSYSPEYEEGQNDTGGFVFTY